MVRVKVLQLIIAIIDTLKQGISKDDAKTIVLNVLRFMQERARLTPGVLDDLIISVAIYLVENHWDLVWSLISRDPAAADELGEIADRVSSTWPNV